MTNISGIIKKLQLLWVDRKNSDMVSYIIIYLKLICIIGLYSNDFRGKGAQSNNLAQGISINTRSKGKFPAHIFILIEILGFD